MADPTDLLRLAIDIAREAGALLLDRDPGRRLDVATKSTETDVVTDKDRAAERLIVSRLRDARPDDAVLGEEGGARGDAAAGVRWLVDPIDGTVNYLYSLPQYAVSIAAEVDGRVGAGVVLDPEKNELYAATRGGGATCNGVPIHCTNVTDLGQTLVATGFAYAAERRRRQAQVLVELLPTVRDIRRLGASSLDLCAVAGGRVDAYYEVGLNRWDVAAGALIAAEAGATVEVVDAGGFAVAAGPGVFDAFQALLTRLGAAEV